MGKNCYFLSDAHLGGLAFDDDRERERKLVRFLDSISEEASDIYLLGDMFDFWYEYHYVVPKGQVRFLGKLAELVDKGVQVHFFIGNHDIWTYGYLEQEIGLKVYRNSLLTEIAGKTFFLSHGDRVGYRPWPQRLMQAVFHNKAMQSVYNMLPSRMSMRFGKTWSKSRRKRHPEQEERYLGEDKEFLVLFAKEFNRRKPVDFFVFGHRHILLDLMITKTSRVIYLGDWIHHFSYGVFDGTSFRLEQFEVEA